MALKWDMKFAALERYAQLNGHCYINTDKEMCMLSDGSEANLGTWLNTQRQMKKKGKLSMSKFLRLQSLVDSGMLSWECKKRFNNGKV